MGSMRAMPLRLMVTTPQREVGDSDPIIKNRGFTLFGMGVDDLLKSLPFSLKWPFRVTKRSHA